jgi:hypothetical protein
LYPKHCPASRYSATARHAPTRRRAPAGPSVLNCAAAETRVRGRDAAGRGADSLRSDLLGSQARSYSNYSIVVRAIRFGLQRVDNKRRAHALLALGTFLTTYREVTNAMTISTCNGDCIQQISDVMSSGFFDRGRNISRKQVFNRQTY